MTKCKFRIAGPTLLRNQEIPYQNVKPGQLVKVDTQITPKTSGEQKIVATFSSKELLDISGTAKVEIFDDEE